MQKREAFTLVELIIVVIVVGVLAAIAIPRYFKTTERVYDAEGVTILKAIFDAQKRYLTEHGRYCNQEHSDECPGGLDVAFPDLAYFDPPKIEGSESHGGTIGLAYVLRRLPGPDYRLNLWEDGTICCYSPATEDPCLELDFPICR